jgi:hypothetical protein
MPDTDGKTTATPTTTTTAATTSSSSSTSTSSTDLAQAVAQKRLRERKIAMRAAKKQDPAAGPESNDLIDADDQAEVDERAKERGVTLKDATLKDRSGKAQDGKLSVGGGSMADNPAFEAHAQQFEHNLGVSTFSRGNAPARAMGQKAKAYMSAKAGAGSWETKTAELHALLKKCGSDNPRWSGSVGFGLPELMRCFDDGDVGRTMCHLENFYTQILVADIKADVEGLDDLLKAGQVSVKNVDTFKNDKKGNAFFTPQGSEVTGQAFTRGDRHDTAKEGANATESKRKVGETGVSLNQDELALHRGADKATPDPQVKLRWEEGAEKWALNEHNKWVFHMRQLSLPLAAGPSGTTNKLMNMGQLLGSDPYDTRLACMGYLLHAHHHSLVEIMAAAQPHGCADFVPGRQMYTSIKPYAHDELLAFGGGKFPHERHDDVVPV